MTPSASSAPWVRAIAILFFAEMTLSPFVAGIALLVPIAADWGTYKYVPAVVWVMIFVQCLITFRWRGLWFLLGPPAAFLAIEAFLVAANPVPRRDAPGVSSVRLPLFIQSPDRNSAHG